MKLKIHQELTVTVQKLVIKVVICNSKKIILNLEKFQVVKSILFVLLKKIYLNNKHFYNLKSNVWFILCIICLLGHNLIVKKCG